MISPLRFVGGNMKTPLFLAMTLMAFNVAIAQAPPPATSNPSSASSPHQRETTQKPANEAPAPSTESVPASPHQKEVTKSDKMMHDCMKRQSQTSSSSKADAKKACEAELKKGTR